MKALILTLDASGYPYCWMSWQDAVLHQVSNRVSRQLGGVAFTFKGGLCRKTGNQSQVTITSIMALRGYNPLAWRKLSIPLTNTALFRRDSHMCAYCGKQGEKGLQLTKDHIIPLSRGGKDDWNNCTTACSRCNHRKNDKTPEEAGMQLLFVPYTPSLHEGLLLANRLILADQMEMLQSMLPKHSRLNKFSA